jgi:hypothetical protein
VAGSPFRFPTKNQLFDNDIKYPCPLLARADRQAMTGSLLFSSSTPIDAENMQ